MDRVQWLRSNGSCSVVLHPKPINSPSCIDTRLTTQSTHTHTLPSTASMSSSSAATSDLVERRRAVLRQRERDPFNSTRSSVADEHALSCMKCRKPSRERRERWALTGRMKRMTTTHVWIKMNAIDRRPSDSGSKSERERERERDSVFLVSSYFAHILVIQSIACQHNCYLVSRPTAQVNGLGVVHRACFFQFSVRVDLTVDDW
jgi:hypothetical protein